MSETLARGSAPAVSIVIPVRNEAGNIAPLVDEIAAALDRNVTFEVLFVNDGSTDRTEAELIELMASRPWLRQIKHLTSFGQSAVVSSGVVQARTGVVVPAHGDGQDYPAFMPARLAGMTEAPRIGLVAGQRVGRQANWFKKLQSRVANAVRSLVLRDGTRDTGCGLKAFRRGLFLALPYFDGLHRFLPALVRREGYDIGYVDVIDRARRAGTSNYGMWDRLWIGIVDLFGVWWLIRRRRDVPQVSEVKRNVDLSLTGDRKLLARSFCGQVSVVGAARLCGANYVHYAIPGAVDRFRTRGKNGDADRVLAFLDWRRRAAIGLCAVYPRSGFH